MHIPVIPIVVAAVLLAALLYVLTFTGPTILTLDAPLLSPIVDVDGIETDVAIAPDGVRYVVVVDGNLWFADTSDGSQRQLTDANEPEASPAWTPDGTRITFSRGPDTFEVGPDDLEVAPFMANANHLSWSRDGRISFVRDRALWVAEADGSGARELLPADENADVTIRCLRFSPDGTELVFIKSMLNLRGEVWRVVIDSAEALPLITDRNAENPTAVDWITDGNHVVYLTDRGGGLALWYIDLEDATMVPMTTPMMGLSLEPLGIAVSGERIVLPRHFIDSDIATSDGTSIIHTDRLEFDPSVSPDGRSIAYTVENEGKFEVWMASIDGTEATYMALGRRPRFAPSGNEIVYTRTNLAGNKDIWKVDRRTGAPVRLTDAEEFDDTPDWSPEGRSIIFASERGGEMSLWTIPASGGKRLKLEVDGYAPRYSDDGEHILYWYRGGIWTAGLNGEEPTRVADAPDPVSGVWSTRGPAFFANGSIQVGDRMTEDPLPTMWPGFDRLPDGGWLVASIQIQKTELWAIDLVFTEK